MSEFVYVSSHELGECPAAVCMLTGTIEINKDVWSQYDEFEQRFIIEHERGHYILQTDSEELADTYALKKVYATVPQSLKRSLRTLCKIGIVDQKRLKSLYKEALKLDAIHNNNLKAKEELNLKNMKVKQAINGQAFLTKNKNYMANNTNKTQEQNKNKHQKPKQDHKSRKANGIIVGNTYLSFSNLLLMAILVVLVLIYKK